ncbi:hypothetical protein [Rhodococcus koreensis]|uniref:hypothetical protein n=1 Tax=Rhodococcus koreensis TaxID=99653 RepID=UPI0036728F1E
MNSLYDTYASSSIQVFLSDMPRAEAERLFERRLLLGPDDGDSVSEFLDELGEIRDRPRFRVPHTMLDSLGRTVAGSARTVSARFGASGPDRTRA